MRVWCSQRLETIKSEIFIFLKKSGFTLKPDFFKKSGPGSLCSSIRHDAFLTPSASAATAPLASRALKLSLKHLKAPVNVREGVHGRLQGGLKFVLAVLEKVGVL